MLAWSEELITDVKTRNPWLWRHCRRRAIYWLLRSPSQHHAKPKTQISRRQTATSFFPLVGCLPQAAWPERLPLRSQDIAAALQQIKGSGALPMIDRALISNRTSAVAAISGLHCGALVMVSSTWKPSLIANSKKRAERSEIDVWAESRLSHSGALHHQSACLGLLIITVITPLPTKAQRDKNAENWSWRTRQLRWHADASAWCCYARCKIHEGVSWC